MNFYSKCIVILLLIPIVINSLRLLILLNEERTYLNKIIDYTFEQVGLDIVGPDQVSETIGVKRLTIQSDALPLEKINSICAEITSPEGIDVIIDLTQNPFRSSDFCSSYHFIMQMDIPYLSFDLTKCNYEEYISSGLSTALLHPSIMAGMGSFSSYLLRNTHSHVSVIFDGSISIENSFSFPSSQDTPSASYYQIPDIDTQIKDPGILSRLITSLRRGINSVAWVFLGDSKFTSSLLSSLKFESESKQFTPSYYRTWILFDQSDNVNLDSCETMCLGSTDNDVCNPPNAYDHFFCATLNNEMTDELLRKTILGLIDKTLDYQEKIISLISYETIHATISALKILGKEEKWKPKVYSTCLDAITADYNQIDKVIRGFAQLPVWKGPLRTIKFTGNKNWHRDISLKFLSLEEKKLVDTQITFDFTNGIDVNDTFVLSVSKYPLKVLLIEEEPFVVVNKDGTYTGLFVNIFEEIALRLNLTYEYSVVEKTDYGIFTEGDSLTGIFNSIASMQGDVGLGPIMIDSGLTDSVDFTSSIMDSVGISMVTSNPNTKNSLFFFTTVFSATVWGITAVLLVITGLLMSFFDRMSPYSYQNRLHLTEGEPDGIIFTLKESMWFVIGAFTQLGECYDPRSNSTRFIICGFWIFTSILTSMFNANLSAFLTVDGLTNNFNSFQELISQSDTKYTVQMNSTSMKYLYTMMLIEKELYGLWSNFSYMKSTNFSVWSYPINERYSDVWAIMENWGYTYSFEESLQEIKKGNVIFMDSPTAQYRSGQYCLTTFGENMGSWEYGIILTRNSPFTKLFNKVILDLKNDLTVETLTNKWLNADAKSCTPVDSTGGFTLSEIGGIFVILACGIVISVFIMLAEKIYITYQKKKKTTQNESTDLGEVNKGATLDLPEQKSFRRVSLASPHHPVPKTPLRNN